MAMMHWVYGDGASGTATKAACRPAVRKGVTYEVTTRLSDVTCQRCQRLRVFREALAAERAKAAAAPATAKRTKVAIEAGQSVRFRRGGKSTIGTVAALFHRVGEKPRARLHLDGGAEVERFVSELTPVH